MAVVQVSGCGTFGSYNSLGTCVVTSAWKIPISWSLNLTSSEQRSWVRSRQVVLGYTSEYTWGSAVSRENAEHPLNRGEEQRNCAWLERNLGQKGAEALVCKTAFREACDTFALILEKARLCKDREGRWHGWHGVCVLQTRPESGIMATSIWLHWSAQRWCLTWHLCTAKPSALYFFLHRESI